MSKAICHPSVRDIHQSQMESPVSYSMCDVSCFNTAFASAKLWWASAIYICNAHFFILANIPPCAAFRIANAI